MSITAPNHFNTQFRAEVKHSYQLMGPQLRGISREVAVVGASEAVFKKMGTSVATTKGRHALIPTQDIAHTTVKAVMKDYYSGEYVDDLDLLKTNVDYRSQYAKSMGMAMGRRYDLTYVTELDSGAGTTVAAGAAGLTLPKIYTALQTLDEANVPASGRTFIIGMEQLRNMRDTMPEFTSFDFNNFKPHATGVTKFSWMGVNWIAFNGLPLASTTRSCFLVHEDAIGMGINKEIDIATPFIDERDATLVRARMSLGAITIEGAGIVQVDCTET